MQKYAQKKKKRKTHRCLFFCFLSLRTACEEIETMQSSFSVVFFLVMFSWQGPLSCDNYIFEREIKEYPFQKGGRKNMFTCRSLTTADCGCNQLRVLEAPRSSESASLLLRIPFTRLCDKHLQKTHSAISFLKRFYSS